MKEQLSPLERVGYVVDRMHDIAGWVIGAAGAAMTIYTGYEMVTTPLTEEMPPATDITGYAGPASIAIGGVLVATAYWKNLRREREAETLRRAAERRNV